MKTNSNRGSSPAAELTSDKVAVIRKALADGSYHVSSLAVADKLIDYMLDFSSSQSGLDKNIGASANPLEMLRAG